MENDAANLPTKVIRDPVHNLIAIPSPDRVLLLSLIDRPEFQRLRRVRQLGVSFLTFPGAEHSRWNHCVGTQHVARQMLDALQARFQGQAEWRELEPYRREILVAALLHDVGHGPFSHLFEKALPQVEGAPPDYPKDHEDWSVHVIEECFADDLKENGVDVDVVCGLINKKDRTHLLAKDFISSQLDADRMDYLLRDSRATGPKYGEFDLAWLLHALRIGKVKVRGQSDGEWRLCFDAEKAIHVVEEFILAREFMYVQVYIHKTTRAYEAMLRNVLGLAAAVCNGGAERAPKPCRPALAKMLAGHPVTTDEYLSLDDFCLWTTFVDWARLVADPDPQLKALGAKCNRLVNRGQPYKFLPLEDHGRQDQALRLVTELEATASPLRFSCYRDEFADLMYRNVFYRKSRESEAEEDRVIHVIEDNKELEAVESKSDVIRAISEIKTQIYRLYYDSKDDEMVERLRKGSWFSRADTHEDGGRDAS